VIEIPEITSIYTAGLKIYLVINRISTDGK